MHKPWKIISADVLETLTEHDLGGPFDAVLSDPPYGLGFMGRAWDHGVPSAEVWAALLTHLRPGANVALFGGTRTYHRLTCAVEDAGFEIRDSVACWMYGSGWPKPADVGKYVDKRQIDERFREARKNRRTRHPNKKRAHWYRRNQLDRFWVWCGREVVGLNPNVRPNRVGVSKHATGHQTEGSPITRPATPEAARFNGWHANLKPAWEPCVLARKPLDGGLARNALEHGVAGLNVDGCRVGSESRWNEPRSNSSKSNTYFAWNNEEGGRPATGRWPANVILTCEEALCGPDDPREIQHHPRCHVAVLDGQSGVTTSSAAPRHNGTGGYCPGQESTGAHRITGGHDDSGGASRFFYVAKVSRAERGGVAHPCMKPQLLCEYVARLLLPPVRMDGLPRRILVPYSGSGSEMLGALRAGWDEVVGIEYDAGRDNPTGTTDHWAREAEHRVTRWARTFAAELDLATEMADQGRVPSSQFKAAGVDPQTWIDAGYARRDPDRRTWLVPGSEPFRRDGHSTDTRVWYRVHAPGLAVPPRP